MPRKYFGRFIAGYRRALKIYPVESRFFLFLTAAGCLGLLLQKETIAAGLAYATFWLSFMLSMMSFWHDDLFVRPDP